MDTNLIQKLLGCHLNFQKCTLIVEYIVVLRVATLIFGENKMPGRTTISAKKTWPQIDFLCTDSFNSEILPLFLVMQSQIWINFNIFVAYVLNLLPNTQRPQLSLTTRWKMEPDSGSWQMPDISRSHLYRGTIAWTHQPRYIESTL